MASLSLLRASRRTMTSSLPAAASSSIASSSSSSSSSAAATRLAQVSRHLSSTAPSSNIDMITKDKSKKQWYAEQNLVAAESSLVNVQELAFSRTYILNRPSKLHALNSEMCDIASHHLDKWSASRLAKALIATSETPLSAEGKKQMPKAFCAGGDIALIARQSVDPKTRGEAMAFFKKEYELDWKLACFSVGQQAHDGSKSYIALMDGITFGGGAGLAFPAAIRVATENTRFAMPETAIGYVPDVGATHYLSLLDGKIGRYLALTGIEVKGRACQDIGLATHYVPSESIPVLHHRLQSYGDFDNHGGIHAILSAIEDHEVPFDSHQVRERKGLNYWRADEPDSPTRLRGIVREALDVAFAKDSIVGIIESLRLNIIEEDPYQGGRTVSPEEKDLSEWAKETIELLKSRSQVSLEVTLEAMRRAEKELDEEEQKLAKEGRRYNSVEPNSALKKALLREYRTVERFVHGFSPDFPSACISKLVDKKPPTFSTEPSSSTLINSFFPTLPEAYYSKPSPNLPLTEPLNLETPVHGFDKYPFRAFGLPSEDDLKSIINGSHPSHTTRSSPYAQDRIPGDFKVSVEMVLAKYDMSRKRMKSRVMEVLRRKCTEDSAGWLTWHDGKRPRRADEWKYDKMEGQGHLWERLGDKQEIVVEDK